MRQAQSTLSSNTSSTPSKLPKDDNKPSEKNALFSANTLFSGMILIVMLGTCGLVTKVYEWMEHLKSLNPEYNLPKLGDILVSFLLTPPMIVI